MDNIEQEILKEATGNLADIFSDCCTIEHTGYREGHAFIEHYNDKYILQELEEVTGKISLYRQLKEFIRLHPVGFTVFISNQKLHEIRPDETLRYAVATTNNNTKQLRDTFILKHILNPKFKGFIGGWFNNSTGYFYLDLVEVHRYKYKALKIGKQHNQKTIYDLYKDKEISLEV